MAAIYGALSRPVNNPGLGGNRCEHRDGGGNRPFPAPRKPLFVTRSNRGVQAMGANPFLWLVSELIWLYIYILIAAAVLSVLIAFHVVNTRNHVVRGIASFLYAVTEPALRPIRALLPAMG